MKLLQLLFKRDLTAPVLALMVASAACVLLVFARIVLTESLRYGFLLWNLLLAWLPLLLALLIREQQAQGGRRGWRQGGLGAAWLLLFPNAPYIFTDLIHLTHQRPGFYWADMMLILLCALTGLMLGFVSLYLMQAGVANRLGRRTGWLFIVVVAGLSGIGVFLGRFLRLNSWDVLLRPGTMLEHLGIWLAHPFGDALPFVFPALFATFLFIAYLMFYTLTKLPATERIFPAEIR